MGHSPHPTDPATAFNQRAGELRVLVGHLREQIAAVVADDSPPTWHNIAEAAQELEERLLVLENVSADPAPGAAVDPTEKQLQDFGKLLRDRRNAAGLSRIELGRLAKLSDATIKYTESARHPPSRATLIRLIDRPELRLTWDDAPGYKAATHFESVPLVGTSVDRSSPPEEAFWDHKPGCLCEVTTPSQVHALALVEKALCRLNANRAREYARRKAGESGP